METFLWVEKYRPTTINDCILPDDLKKTFGIFVQDKEMIIKIYDSLLNKYISDIRADTTGYSSSRFYLLKINEARNSLITNLNKLSEKKFPWALTSDGIVISRTTS